MRRETRKRETGALVCNDLDGRSRHGRSKLSVYLSDDEGSTWKWNRSFEDNPDDINGFLPDGNSDRGWFNSLRIHLHTPKPKETIKHVWFNEDWIRAGNEK